MKVTKTVGNAASPNLLLYVERNCYSNCLMNWKRMEVVAGTPLKMVSGSLGLNNPPPVWFEWGGAAGKAYSTVKQFSSCPVTGLPDIHFWFQDADGKVWDVVDPYIMHTVAPVHKKTVMVDALLDGCFIAGKTCEELKSLGLLYIPADPLVQDVMAQKHSKNITFVPL
jgi:hypothetical protein